MIKVSTYYAPETGNWCVFVDDDKLRGESALVKKWKSEGEAEMHAEIIRCAMAWEPSRAGRRWRTRTKPGRRSGGQGYEVKRELTQLRTFEVNLVCACGGRMRPTGLVLATMPPLYLHKCEGCGHESNQSTKYPTIEYERMSEEESDT